MKKVIKNKNGFTLLEVILAVAILLTATTMIMSGFMSTLQYTNNTSLYRTYGNLNSMEAKLAIQKTALNNFYGARSGDVILSVSGVNIPDIEMSFTLHALNGHFGSANDLSSPYMENPSVSVNRYSVTYTPPACPVCGEHNTMRNEEYYDENGDRVVSWFCMSDTCPYRDKDNV